MKKTAAAGRSNSPKRNGVARAIIFVLRQADTGVPVTEVCRKMGVSEATARAAPLLQLESGRRSIKNTEA